MMIINNIGDMCYSISANSSSSGKMKALNISVKKQTNMVKRNDGGGENENYVYERLKNKEMKRKRRINMERRK
jgi:hypothetical protein